MKTIIKERMVGVLEPEISAYKAKAGNVNNTAIWVGVIYRVILVRSCMGRYLIIILMKLKIIKASRPKWVPEILSK
jgi:hypothetical protein